LAEATMMGIVLTRRIRAMSSSPVTPGSIRSNTIRS
jgi:hypothetical protein